MIDRNKIKVGDMVRISKIFSDSLSRGGSYEPFHKIINDGTYVKVTSTGNYIRVFITDQLFEENGNLGWGIGPEYLSMKPKVIYVIKDSNNGKEKTI